MTNPQHDHDLALLAAGHDTGFWDEHGNPAPWPDDIERRQARQRRTHHPRTRRATLLNQPDSKDQPIHHVQGLGWRLQSRSRRTPRALVRSESGVVNPTWYNGVRRAWRQGGSKKRAQLEIGDQTPRGRLLLWRARSGMYETTLGYVGCEIP